MATFNNGESGLSIRTKLNNVMQHADGSSSTLIFNESGGDVDIRMEAVAHPNAFFLDGGTSNVGIGTGTPAAKLSVITNDANSVSMISDGDLQLYWPAGPTRAYTFLSKSVGSSMVGGNLRLNDSVTTGTHIGYSSGTDQRGGAGIVFTNTTGGASAYGETIFVRSNDTNDDTWQVLESARINSSGNFIVTGNAQINQGLVVDTSTLVVDATNNRVGIGTPSPTYKLEVRATTNDGILLDDAGLATAAPALKVRGKRSDSNGSQSFAGKLLLEGNRTDAAVVANKQLGVIAFGGNHTDGNVANVLYAASISGTAEGTFSGASAMPTALTFFTGSTGILDTVANQTMGTERMRISATGGVSIGSTADPGSTNLSVAGVVSHSVGSAATPSITFTGDLDTGIYSSALNVLAISTAGVQRARFSADSVIIPAVSTESKLLEIGQGRTGDGISAIDLVGDATYTDHGARFIRLGGANGNTQLVHRGTGGLQLTALDAGVVQVLTNGLERMRITSTGDVGIGTTTPVMPLDVNGDTLCRGIEYNIQPTQTSIAAAATLTIAQLLTKIIQYTGAVANLTLPTGTLIEGGIHASSPNNTSFDFSVINTGSGAATLLTATGLTLVGSMVVTNGTSALFRVRKTATNTFTVYRLA